MTFLRPGKGNLEMEREGNDSHRGRQAGGDRAKKTASEGYPQAGEHAQRRISLSSLILRGFNTAEVDDRKRRHLGCSRSLMSTCWIILVTFLLYFQSIVHPFSSLALSHHKFS